mmetsp:Transcript_61574/g.141951  ORF Transcript_61574/g.141951 Transcript_61574/m.141951 type:complete len:155 (+) Transcript_61574:31-495(+)
MARPVVFVASVVVLLLVGVVVGVIISRSVHPGPAPSPGPAPPGPAPGWVECVQDQCKSELDECLKEQCSGSHFACKEQWDCVSKCGDSRECIGACHESHVYDGPCGRTLAMNIVMDCIGNHVNAYDSGSLKCQHTSGGDSVATPDLVRRLKPVE